MESALQGHVMSSEKHQHDPMKAWSNHDLLLDDAFRAVIRDTFPLAFPALDWPELREEFRKHDLIANEAKSEITNHGRRGVYATAIGAALIAWAPLTVFPFLRNGLLAIGCALVALGMIVCFYNYRAHSAKYRRLTERIWTERLRQFHFQHIISNMSSALNAGVSEEGRATYYRGRGVRLAEIVDDMRRKRQLLSAKAFIGEYAGDLRNDHLWTQQTSWSRDQTPATLKDHPASEQMFECLLKARIDVQLLYAASQLDKDRETQLSRSQQAGEIADFSAIGYATVMFVGGALAWFLEPIWLDLTLAISGTLAAAGLSAQLISKGMGLEGDVSRYRVYHPQCVLCRERFTMQDEHDDPQTRLLRRMTALRDLERYAYEEMRGFLQLHAAARFW